MRTGEYAAACRTGTAGVQYSPLHVHQDQDRHALYAILFRALLCRDFWRVVRSLIIY